MKFIESAFAYDEGFVKNGKNNGNIKTQVTAINVAHIVSVKLWVGKNVGYYGERIGSEIVDINGKKHFDDRPHSEIIELIMGCGK